jgi:hypothetical protein
VCIYILYIYIVMYITINILTVLCFLLFPPVPPARCSENRDIGEKMRARRVRCFVLFMFSQQRSSCWCKFLQSTEAWDASVGFSEGTKWTKEALYRRSGIKYDWNESLNDDVKIHDSERIWIDESMNIRLMPMLEYQSGQLRVRLSSGHAENFSS